MGAGDGRAKMQVEPELRQGMRRRVDVVDHQLKRGSANPASLRHQTVPHRRGHRTGKRQGDVQVFRRHLQPQKLFGAGKSLL